MIDSSASSDPAAHAASSSKNSLAPRAFTFSPYHCDAVTVSERRARVSATYIVRRSSITS